MMQGSAIRYRQFEVIDACHLLHDLDPHLDTELYEHVTAAFADESNATIERLNRLAVMDAQGIRGAVVLASGQYLRPEGIVDTRRVNDAVAAYRDRDPTRFVAAVGHVDPLHGAAGVDEVARCADELGLRGISFAGVNFIMRPLIEKAAELGLVPFIHVGARGQTIWQVDSIARDFPDLPMIVLHIFNGIDQVGSLTDVAGRHPNLYFDLSGSLALEIMGLPHIRRIGADRFLYATRTHSWPLHSRPFGELLSDIVDVDLAEEDKAAILGGNVKRILGLPSHAGD